MPNQNKHLEADTRDLDPSFPWQMWMAGASDSEASQRFQVLCPSSTHNSPKRRSLLIPIFRSDFGFYPSLSSSPTKPRDLGHRQEPLWEEEPVSLWREAPSFLQGSQSRCLA